MVKMESMARTLMHGRLLRCPMGGNPPDCPLYEIRLLPFEERIIWLESKTDFELTSLLGYHLNCFEKKISGVA